jgi:hypothetical protein
MLLTCHGGEQYEMALSTVATCSDLSTLPGFTTVAIGGTVTFQFLGADNQSFFVCGPP